MTVIVTVLSCDDLTDIQCIQFFKKTRVCLGTSESDDFQRNY